LKRYKKEIIMPESIYPETFFKLPHPLTPYVNVQFRTAITGGEDIANSENWEEITIDPNSFLDSVTIEDSGGFYSVNVSVFDKNFARMEDIIIRTLLSARITNKLVKTTEPKRDDKNFFQFFIDKSTAVNMRVRFGYSHIPKESSDFIDDSSFNGDEYLGRIKDTRPVLRSPWIYLQILKFRFNVTPEGMRAEIIGLSTTNNFFSKAKLVQKFAKLRGTPKNVLGRLGEIISEASKSASDGEPSLIFAPWESEANSSGNSDEKTVTSDDPSEYINEDGNTEIEIMLGGKPRINKNTGEVINSYRTIKSILNEICSKISAKAYDVDEQAIKDDSDPNTEDKKMETIDRIMRYRYMVKEEANTAKVVFYYQDTNKQFAEQEKIRTYIQVEHGQSIIRNLNVESDTDWMQLNLPIAMKGENGEIDYYSAIAKELEEDNKDAVKEDSSRLSKIVKFSDIAGQDFVGTFVADVKRTDDNTGSGGMKDSRLAAQAMMREMIANLNASIFRGSMEIPLDPFYLFDTTLKPFQYLIKIIVKRPTYWGFKGPISKPVDERSYSSLGGETSYVSGNYTVNKITHKIDSSGGSTTLELLKIPKMKEK